MYKIPIQTAVPQNNSQDNFDKGKDFENYIRNLFNEKSFDLKVWRKAEKFIDRNFSFDPSYPDLELIFVGAKKHRFAVECKWRKEFKQGKIQWANNYQRCSYMDFYYRRGIPVFVAIGIGGEPSSPEKLFVTPLINIQEYTEVYESQLIPFKRKATSKFFYDTRQLKLF
jgi:hypothetical protein